MNPTIRNLGAIILATLTAGACSQAPTAPSASPVASAAKPSSQLAPEGWDLQSSFTVSGDLLSGNTVLLNLNVANVGLMDYPGPGFGFQFLMPADVNRTNPLPLGATCEGYRGHQGGSNIIRDFCYASGATSAGLGPIPAGTTHTVSLPVKLARAGDFVVYGSTNGTFFQFPLLLHVTDPVKVGGGTTASYKLSVSLNGKGTVAASPSASSYPAGTVVTLTATPAAGSLWTGWSGACGGLDLSCTLTLDANASVTANFR